MTHCLIIAEAGVNHNGDLALAKQLINAAVDAGADAVKFQTFQADLLASADAGKAPYQKNSTHQTESQRQMLARLQLDAQAHEELLRHAGQHGIELLSTPFDIPSIDLLEQLDLRRFKIPSGEITNIPYLRHIGRLKKPLILSTGMATLGETERAIDTLTATGMPRNEITLLHANSAYPTPMQDVNLRAMQTLQPAFALPCGYSDHTPGIEIPVAAVALGACVIEKHFTLDRNLPGPDHAASLEPDELAAMVRAIRNVESAMGSPVKRPTASEKINRPMARKRIVATTTIRKGEPFSSTNLTTQRAPAGLCASCWDEVTGRKANREYQAGEGIIL